MILCEKFPGLDPLSLGEHRAVEIFKLVKSLNHYIDTHEKDKKNNDNYSGSNKGKSRFTVKVTDS
jgi:hypothetical protein